MCNIAPRVTIEVDEMLSAKERDKTIEDIKSIRGVFSVYANPSNVDDTLIVDYSGQNSTLDQIKATQGVTSVSPTFLQL